MVSLGRYLALVVVAATTVLTPPMVRGEPAANLARSIEIIREVGPQGVGHVEAIRAWRQLAEVEPIHLPGILEGMDSANPIAMNWLRAAFETIASRAINEGAVPALGLEQFISERRHDPRARRLAFEWLERVDPTARTRLIPTMLDDPSLELRRDAVALVMDAANDLASRGLTEKAVEQYKLALTAARDIDQIDALAAALGELEVKVDLARHFGFITRWKLIGPFDNSNLRGFATAFPPETEIDVAKEYRGKLGTVAWFDYQTDDRYGMVDLNRAIGKYNGVTAYAYFDFVSDEARDVELRLGSINANKVWLNGELLTSNEVYHTNTSIDQYIGRGRLKKGGNAILVKICQNEQTEDWAQRWQFQLRVCDASGSAILPVEGAP